MKYKEVMPKILGYISEGMNQKEAFEKAGVVASTFYKWMAENSDFSDAVHKAQEEARNNRRTIEEVEAALIDRARGFEREEVRTEYISKQNEDGKYIPVVSKQTRTTKHYVPDVDAIKFYLTNRDPERWKNRVEQNMQGQVSNELRIRYIGKEGDEIFPDNEDDVDMTREVK